MKQEYCLGFPWGLLNASQSFPDETARRSNAHTMVQIVVRSSRNFVAHVDAGATVHQTKDCLAEISGEFTDLPGRGFYNTMISWDQWKARVQTASTSISGSNTTQHFRNSKSSKESNNVRIILWEILQWLLLNVQLLEQHQWALEKN